MMQAEQLLETGAAKLGISLGKEQAATLLLYFAELKKWNRRINLIARETSDTAIIEKHFLDSMTLLPFVQKKEKVRLLDIGSGAGFPGLVLAALCPKMQVTLVEPRSKRVTFLRHIIRTLKLDQAEIITDRVESVSVGKGVYTFVTSRAVAAPLVFLEMARPFMEEGAKAIIMMAREDRLEEIKQGGNVIVEEVLHLLLPFSGAARIVGVVR